MKPILVIVLAVAGATGLALQPGYAGTWKLWALLLLPYVILSPFALAYLGRKGTLKRTASLKGGDTSIGIVSGLACVLLGLLLLKHSAPPGSAPFAWMFQVYAQVGPFQQDAVLLVLVLVLICLEELVWRGLVLQVLKERLGQGAILVSALLYALAQAPTLLALRDPSAGFNPLVVAVACVMGIVWSTLASVTGRLVPVVLSHAVFLFFMAAPLPSWLTF